MSAAKFGLALVCLAVGAAAGFVLRPVGADPDEVAALEDQLADALAAAQAAQEHLAGSEQRARAAERDLRSARRELSATDAAVHADSDASTPSPAGAATESGDGAPALEPAEWAARVAAWPVYGLADADPVVAQALADVDWVAVAGSMAAMVPVADRIAAAIAAGTPPMPEDIGNAQKYNGPLVVAALKLNQAGLPGTGPNGSFSHPAFMANAIAGTLEAVGLPLDAAQSERLGTLAADYSRREQERIGGYADDVVELRRIVEEAEQKDAYFTEVLAMLSAAQRTALSPAASRGRLQLDVFSGALVWAGRAQALGYRDRAHLVELLEGRFMSAVREGSQERAHDLVTAWADQLPPEIMAFERDTLDESGLFRVEHINRCAHAVVDLLETLLRDGDVGEAATSALRKSGGTVVPFALGDR